MASFRKVPFALVLVYALFAASTAAAGGDEEDARVHFDQGLALYEDGQYEQAAIAFARAYEIKPSYRLLFNIGQAEAELKHYTLALDAFTRYLSEAGGDMPPDREKLVRSEIARLEVLVGSIAIDCGAPGAKVKVDNETRGETPLAGPIYVDIGKHEVVVSMGADELLREVVRVGGGQTIELEAACADGGAAKKAGSDKGAPAEVEPPARKGRVWTWVALGVGAAAGITGGAIGGAAMSRKSALEGDCVGSHCPPSAKSEADTISTMNLTADVLYGVAGAAIITGVILFFVEPDDDAEPTVAIAPAFAGDGAGLTIEGRF